VDINQVRLYLDKVMLHLGHIKVRFGHIKMDFKVKANGIFILSQETLLLNRYEASQMHLY